MKIFLNLEQTIFIRLSANYYKFRIKFESIINQNIKVHDRPRSFHQFEGGQKEMNTIIG